MRFQNRIFFVIGALALVAVVVAAVRSTRPFGQAETPLPTLSVTASTVPTLTAFPEGISTLVPKCTLEGTIEYFVSQGIFRHQNAFFRYENVEDPHDFIFWYISPEGEDVSIGPNRFSGLSLPKGQETLTIGFPAPPQKKEYRLSASIQYPYFINGQVQVLTKACTGSIRLVIR
ncbi:MAG: hypothetical protein AAB864_02685 [Patescibacteria group bacterium]